MAVVNPPTFLSGNTTEYPPEADRRHSAAFLTANGRNTMRARPGVKPGTLTVSAPGNGLFIDVADGTAVVQSEDINGGVYVCQATSPTRITAPSADGSLPRRDLVVARVYDSAARREWALEIIPGAPNANPVVPSTPVNSHALAWYQLPAGATRITDSMVNATALDYVAVGGILPVASNAARPSGPHPGQTIFSRADKRGATWDGDAWKSHSYIPDRALDLVQPDYFQLGEGTDLTGPRGPDRLVTRNFSIPGSSRVFVDGGITVSSINGGSRGQFIVRIDGFYAGHSRWRARSAGDVWVGLHGRAPVATAGTHSVTVEVVTDGGRAQLWFLHWDISADPVT